MDRRLFLRRAALIAAGAIAADQLDLIERLTHVRKSFPVNGFLNRLDLWSDGHGYIWTPANPGLVSLSGFALIGYVVTRRGILIEWRDHRGHWVAC